MSGKWKIRKLAAGLSGGVVLLGLAFGAGMNAATAADWSDTSIGWRYGTKFREPVDPDNISKNIIDFQHASGYKYGVNFFNIDLLMSDSKDPSAGNSTAGAQEAYVVYRNTGSLSKSDSGRKKLPPAAGSGGA